MSGPAFLLALWLGFTVGGAPLLGAAPKPADYSLPKLGEAPASHETNMPSPVARVSPTIAPEISIDLLHGGSESWRLVSRSAKAERVLVEVPKDEAATLLPQNLLATFPIQASAGLEAVVWVYVIGSGLRYEDFRTTYLAVCVLDRGVLVGSCRTEAVAETSVHVEIQTQPEAVWLYWAADADQPKRATRSDVRLLVRDQDGDGFADLVIWRRTCGSLSIADSAARERDPKTFAGKIECNLDFVLVSDECLVLRFDPNRRTFDAPKLDDKLPVPERDLWDRLPGIGHLSIP